MDITTAFKAYNQGVRSAGGTIPTNQQVYRIKVVTAFLHAGIQLNKINCFRELLEENVTRLAGRRSLSDLIPSSTRKK